MTLQISEEKMIMELITDEENAACTVTIPRINAETSGLDDVNEFDAFDGMLENTAVNASVPEADVFIMSDNNIDFLYQALCAATDGGKQRQKGGYVANYGNDGAEIVGPERSGNNVTLPQHLTVRRVPLEPDYGFLHEEDLDQLNTPLGH